MNIHVFHFHHIIVLSSKLLEVLVNFTMLTVCGLLYGIYHLLSNTRNLGKFLPVDLFIGFTVWTRCVCFVYIIGVIFQPLSLVLLCWLVLCHRHMSCAPLSVATKFFPTTKTVKKPCHAMPVAQATIYPLLSFPVTHFRMHCRVHVNSGALLDTEPRVAPPTVMMSLSK